MLIGTSAPGRLGRVIPPPVGCADFHSHVDVRTYVLPPTSTHLSAAQVVTYPCSSPAGELVTWSRQRDVLENSGVRVHEIAEYEDLPLLLTELVRRTRPPRLFISGNKTDDTHDRVCEEMAKALADRTEWEVCSLVGSWAGNHAWIRADPPRRGHLYDPTRLAERRGDLDTRQLGG